MNKDQKIKSKIGESSGFIRIIVILAIVILIASFLGFNPESLWTKIILPIVEIVWKIAIWFANILYFLLKLLSGSLEGILNFFSGLVE